MFVKRGGIVVPPVARFINMDLVVHAVRRKCQVYMVMQHYLRDATNVEAIEVIQRHTDLRGSIISIYHRRVREVVSHALRKTGEDVSSLASYGVSEEWSRMHMYSSIALFCSDNIIMPLNLYMVYYDAGYIDFNLPGYRRSYSGMMLLAQHVHTSTCKCFRTDWQKSVWAFLHVLWCTRCIVTDCCVHGPRQPSKGSSSHVCRYATLF